MPADKTVARRSDSNHRARHLLVPYADPRTRVAPARANAVHMAISITCLVVLLLAGISAVVATYTGGGVSSAEAWPIGTVSGTGILIMMVAEWWFRRSRGGRS